MGSLFFAQCIVDLEAGALLAELRPAHLGYVGARRAMVVFGGLVESGALGCERICYFLRASSFAEAEEFVVGDPYYACFSKVEILPFTQKIP